MLPQIRFRPAGKINQNRELAKAFASAKPRPKKPSAIYRESRPNPALKGGHIAVHYSQALAAANVKQVTADHWLPRYPIMRRGPGVSRMVQMTTPRMAYWWFWFVVSGRFLQKFLKLRSQGAPENSR